MYEIVHSKKFRIAHKKLRKSGKFNSEELECVVKFLSVGKELPEIYRDHLLRGNMSEHRECHLSNSLLLIYKINNTLNTVTLAEIGTHAQLFGL